MQYNSLIRELFNDAVEVGRNVRNISKNLNKYMQVGVLVAGIGTTAYFGDVACANKTESYIRSPVIEQQATPTPEPTATCTPLPTGTSIRELTQTYTSVPTAAPTPDPYVMNALDPTVRGYIEKQPWYLDGINEREFQLLKFLGDANKSTGRDRRLPLVIVPEGSSVRYIGFDVDRQMRVLENGLYDYVQLQGKEILLVISSINPLQRSQAEGTINMAKKYSPQVDAFVGGRYSFYFLHVEIETSANFNYSSGANIFLRRGFATRSKSFAHENVHNYQNYRYPKWYKEGIADLIAIHLTGDSVQAYGQFFTGEKIRLEASEGNAQAASGYVFLKEVFDVIGPDVMSAATNEIFTDTKSGQQVLDIILKHTADEKKGSVKAIYAKWVEGYTP